MGQRPLKNGAHSHFRFLPLATSLSSLTTITIAQSLAMSFLRPFARTALRSFPRSTATAVAAPSVARASLVASQRAFSLTPLRPASMRDEEIDVEEDFDEVWEQNMAARMPPRMPGRVHVQMVRCERKAVETSRQDALLTTSCLGSRCLLAPSLLTCRLHFYDAFSLNTCPIQPAPDFNVSPNRHVSLRGPSFHLDLTLCSSPTGHRCHRGPIQRSLPRGLCRQVGE